VLYYLKYIFIESEEGVVNRWLESAYWQFFCRKPNKYSASASCTQHHSANGVTVSVIFLCVRALIKWVKKLSIRKGAMPTQNK